MCPLELTQVTAVTSSPELFHVVAVSNPCAIGAFHTTVLSYSGPCFFHEPSIQKPFCLTLFSPLHWSGFCSLISFSSSTLFLHHLTQGGFIHFGVARCQVPEPHPTSSGNPKPLCWPFLPVWELCSISVTFQLDSVTSETKRHFREAEHRKGRISYALKKHTCDLNLH